MPIGDRNPYHRERAVWRAMRKRCSPNADLKDVPYYYERGIRVCERWSGSFEAFLADVGPRPSPRHTISRIDGTRGYEPGNVEWTTAKGQLRGKRGVHLSAEAAVQIRWLCTEGGFPRRTVAQAFGVIRKAIDSLMAGDTWAWATGQGAGL